MNPNLRRALTLAIGLFFGFALGNIGFADYGEVQKMFTFADLRMFLSFGGGLAVTMIGFALLRGKRELPKRRFHKGIVPGGVLFGAGWALTGGCPTITLVQLGEGQLPALITLAGILAGIGLYDRVHPKLFGWDRGSCDM